MSQAHALVGEVAVVLGAIAAVWAVALVLTRRPVGSLFLGGLVWVGMAIGIAAVLGVGTAITGGPPHDPLHLVYGALALGVLPGAAVAAAGRTARQRTIIVALATIVLLIILLRLVQTGA